ncbi:hypothetical protein IEK_01260 [Bacillus toyonensis]|nr:hypothetical protein IEK_01260 [Bacillus toyonensis]
MFFAKKMFENFKNGGYHEGKKDKDWAKGILC